MKKFPVLIIISCALFFIFLSGRILFDRILIYCNMGVSIVKEFSIEKGEGMEYLTFSFSESGKEFSVKRSLGENFVDKLRKEGIIVRYYKSDPTNYYIYNIRDSSIFCSIIGLVIGITAIYRSILFLFGKISEMDYM